eukprot:1070518-Prymnesium_polylepis.1
MEAPTRYARSRSEPARTFEQAETSTPSPVGRSSAKSTGDALIYADESEAAAPSASGEAAWPEILASPATPAPPTTR